ncbi:MAG: tripartite tricarboxylate transporter substrate binding protein [Clostridiales Family XIII bacterium]|jgi:tripartite-type tricarboxylate transporter receptor subunit TctC|nr:tripartite tricarboxylate transporter substrate binding protein [Clostridiales Family XIII bacterium]
MRKKLLVCVLLSLLLLSFAACSQSSQQAPAQTGDAVGEQPAETVNPAIDGYPKKNIELICPSAAGTGFDALSRKLAEVLPKYLPDEVTIFVSNLNSGGGSEGWTKAYGADADGYTLLLYGIPDSLIAQELYERPYDIKEMTPLAGLTYEPTTCLAYIDSDVNTLDELMEKAKTKPVVYGTSGAGGSTHLEALVTTTVLDIPARFVHFSAVPEIITSFERGETEFLSISLPTSLMWISEEKAKPLVVFAKERQKELPDVPTIYEVEGVTQEQADKLSDIQQYRRAVWAPPGMDPELQALLTDAIQKSVTDPDFAAWSEEVGRPITFVPGTEFGTFVESMYDNHSAMMDVYRDAIVN